MYKVVPDPTCGGYICTMWFLTQHPNVTERVPQIGNGHLSLNLPGKKYTCLYYIINAIR